jgi:hypothetical protein
MKENNSIIEDYDFILSDEKNIINNNDLIIQEQIMNKYKEQYNIILTINNLKMNIIDLKKEQIYIKNNIIKTFIHKNNKLDENIIIDIKNNIKYISHEDNFLVKIYQKEFDKNIILFNIIKMKLNTICIKYNQLIIKNLDLFDNEINIKNLYENSYKKYIMIEKYLRNKNRIKREIITEITPDIFENNILFKKQKII